MKMKVKGEEVEKEEDLGVKKGVGGVKRVSSEGREEGKEKKKNKLKEGAKC